LWGSWLQGVSGIQLPQKKKKKKQNQNQSETIEEQGPNSRGFWVGF
jgi:hypothetical protein